MFRLFHIDIYALVVFS